MNNIDHNLLDMAFQLNTSGGGSAYYAAKIEDKHYPGERNWDERWPLIKNCIDFNGKRMLELGCNMAIATAYLKRYCSAGPSVGVDLPDAQLLSSNKPCTIEAARLLSEAFNVEIDFKQVDMNSQNYEEILGTGGVKYDVAIAMSILKWISDKDRFMQYLSAFPNVIYEGHEPDQIEIDRFKQFGFNHTILGTTQTGTSYAKDNTRTVILFTK